LNTSHFRRTGPFLAIFLLALLWSRPQIEAQPREPANSGAVQGCVRDSKGHAVANATVSLQIATGALTDAPTLLTYTDSEGVYRLANIQSGSYTLRAQTDGYSSATASPVKLAQGETTKIDLILVPDKSAAMRNSLTGTSGKPAVPAPDFFDEPHFTVAGVTQASSSGGHGSDTVLRTTEALARATIFLSGESGEKSSAGAKPAASTITESSLLDAVARDPNDPALHNLLGDVEERLGDPLQAVREYQRAAELDPIETNLFDWGTELLKHGALEPATEVFTKGNRLFPTSMRMLVALGVALYARGSYDKATECLVSASDLAPDNPAPYLFLGKMQSVETAQSEKSMARLARFARLHPDNALASYYYALGLSKQLSVSITCEHKSQRDVDLEARVESLFQKAVRLNPQLGAAHLQLGIIYSRREDFSAAISSYRKAIQVCVKEANPDPRNPDNDETLSEAHYRLARAYLHIGDKAEAKEQLQLHDESVKKTKDDTKRKLRETEEFVISMKE
jgi:tetratricopeptide (TPR) repeat protein